MWSWYTGRLLVGCYIWYSKEGTGWDRSLPKPLVDVPNATAHPSTASVLITVLLDNGLLHACSFNVPAKGLSVLCLLLSFSKWACPYASWFVHQIRTTSSRSWSTPVTTTLPLAGQKPFRRFHQQSTSSVRLMWSATSTRLSDEMVTSSARRTGSLRTQEDIVFHRK